VSRIVATAHTATTVNHDARPSDTLAIVADVPDPTATGAVSPTEAESAVARMHELSADLTGCALLDPAGTLLAASGDRETWQRAARGLLAAADAATGEPVSHAHVGTEDGEAFLVRQDGLALVAASERFPLSSLMFSDMRAVLRELTRGSLRAAAKSHAA
jgi:hypothetical protein